MEANSPIPHDPRDLEWQRRYEQNDTPWDKGEASPALARYLQEHEIRTHVLVPGCGRGHEVRLLGARPGCMAVGLDLSPTAIVDATAMAGASGYTGTVSFIVGDFFQPPAELTGPFDWVVEHTCFCAIEPLQRAAYVEAAASVLSPGGKLFGIFYLTPDTESGPPFAVSKEELSDLFRTYFDLLEEWVPEESFPGRENRELVQILRKR
jgi:cyclopropane fatty-acyl-phospholipid synthase-like methyltransferase